MYSETALEQNRSRALPGITYYAEKFNGSNQKKYTVRLHWSRIGAGHCPV